MADKEATVFVIDLGETMGKKEQGRDMTNVEWAMQYVWDKIGAKVLSGRKTDVVGIVGFRTSRTDNELSSEEGYHHIMVLLPIQQILMPQIRSIKKLCVPHKENKGDVISALIVGLDVLMKYCRHLKYIKNIIIVTDGRGEADWSQTEDIAHQINKESTNLSIFGVDFDDAEYGFKEENKPPHKKDNENRLRGLATACEGVFATMAEVVSSLSEPRKKQVRPVPSYRGLLTIGNRDSFDSAVGIEVERYPRTKKAAAPSATKYVKPTEGKGEEQPTQGGHVGLQRTYKTQGGEEVEKEELVKGYTYGSTIVPIPESELQMTKLDTDAELSIIGFVPNRGFKRCMALSDTNAIFAQRSNARSQIALSSLIHALQERELLALARLVTKDGRDPVLIMMAPEINNDFECLVDFQIPFAEDVRHYTFAPLDKVITMKGKVLTKHRNLPTEEQDEAMSDYVDSMLLTNYPREDGEDAPYLRPEDTYSPLLHRINQVITYRAINPDKPIPPPLDILVKYSKPPPDITKASEKVRARMIEAFNVKKVPPKKLAKRKRENEVKPISGLDIEALLLRGTEDTPAQAPEAKKARLVGQIGHNDPAKDFKRLMEDDQNSWGSVFKEMENVIRDVITKSYADTNYEKAIKALKVYRSETIEYDEPRLYNEYIQSLKKDLLDGKLDGNRQDFWKLMKSEKVGLVTFEETEVDQIEDISEREAEKFWES